MSLAKTLDDHIHESVYKIVAALEAGGDDGDEDGSAEDGGGNALQLRGSAGKRPGRTEAPRMESYRVRLYALDGIQWKLVR